jgi:hypothetical protein
MSLRLTSEDGLAAYLTAASKPAGLYVQAGHRIADLQLPACIVHAESSVPVVEGSLATTRKVTFTCSILTPLEVASTVTAHRTNFDWLNTKLTAVNTIAGATLMGGYLGEESTGSNDKVMEDSVKFTAFVQPS